MKHLTGLLAVAIALVMLCMQVPAQAISYTGTLTSTDGGLLGSGVWLDKTLLDPQDQIGWTAPTLTWTVTQNSDLSWHYQYILTVPSQAVSHFIVETSPTFGRANMWGEQGPYTTIEFNDFTAGGGGNPGMPSDVHGVKFDSTWGTTAQFDFNSNRVPVWGDFYAKDGKTAGIDNALWNSGFTLPDYDPDALPSNGAYMGHLLVPDTVPEPASFVSLAAGLMGILGMVRRRRQ